MTATEPAPLVCPQCGSTNTSVGGSGNGMCFECTHIWDPAEVVALPRPALEPFAMAPAEEVFGPPPADTNAAHDPETPEPADWFDVQPAPAEPPNALQFPATWSGLAMYRQAGGSMSNETWWAEIMGSPPDDIDPVLPAEPEAPIEVQAALALAGEIIVAGITAAYTMTHPEAQFVAPTGYLPTDKNMLPIVEQACAVAIGMLIERSGHSVEDFAEGFGVELASVNQGDQTTEVASVEGRSEEG